MQSANSSRREQCRKVGADRGCGRSFRQRDDFDPPRWDRGRTWLDAVRATRAVGAARGIRPQVACVVSCQSDYHRRAGSHQHQERPDAIPADYRSILWGTNHPPQFREATKAIINRIVVIECRREFSEDAAIGVALRLARQVSQSPQS